jgi:mRNA deadenylase 3'-5' endonuclease subunit Ccr4
LISGAKVRQKDRKTKKIVSQIKFENITTDILLRFWFILFHFDINYEPFDGVFFTICHLGLFL